MSQFLKLIQEQANNLNLSDAEFRDVVKGALLHIALEETDSFPMDAPLLCGENADILTAYLSDRDIFNDLNLVATAHKIDIYDDCVIMDLTGYDDETDVFYGLADLIGENNAKLLIGKLVQFLWIDNTSPKK